MRLSLEYHHILTHAGCMDGAASAIIFLHAGGKKENIHWVMAGKVSDALSDLSFIANPNVPLLIVDLHPDTEAAVDFLHRRGNFYVIDHHKSAERFASMPGYVISKGNLACGCDMFREWLASNGMTKFDDNCYKNFTSMVDDHDRWIQSSKMSKELPLMMSIIGHDGFVDMFSDIQNRFQTKRDSYWTENEKAMVNMLYEAQKKRFKNLFEKFVKKTYEDKVIAYIVSEEMNTSELLHKYLLGNHDVDAACQINFARNSVSIRSNDRLDISEFAMKRDGGGHKNSGGYPIPDGLVSEIIERIHA